MLLKIARNAAGYLIILIDWLSRPKPTQRSPESQKAAQSAMGGLSLYQLKACPFCVKTRRALHSLNVKLPINDIGKDLDHRQALEAGGGRVKVPCLKIENHGETQWMYESSDIINFISQRVETNLSNP